LTRDFGSFYREITGKEPLTVWQKAKIHKITVNSQNKAWLIYIQVTDTLPAETLHETSEDLRARITYLDHLEIIPLVAEPEHKINEIITTRRSEIASSFFEQRKMADRIKWTVKDKRLDLVAEDEEAFDYLIEHEVCNRLAEWFMEQCSLPVLVRALVTASEEPLPVELTISDTRAEVLDLRDYSNAPRQSGKRERHRIDLDQQKPIPLLEVQEGLKNLVVEGEIWKKELSPIRGDRYVITYYLTDCTDTLLIKTFADRLEDDRIKVGDVIRAGGNLRYDDIAHELVLFLDNYQTVEKKERSDSSEDKRIELHAHTKMSAMDGLCDISALIKRAAEWEHPAIAITDHGCIQAFPEAYQASQKHHIKIIYGVEGYLIEDDKKQTPYHIVMLARNRVGLKNLYGLISESYLNYYYRQPRIPRRLLNEKREGILLGSACEAGELYRALINGASDEEMKKIALFYDYLEIQPLANNDFLIREGTVKDREELQKLNRYIVELAKKLDKPVVATGDVHFLDPQDEVYRRIIQSGQGYQDADSQAPLYFKTTTEMLEECAYLGDVDARRVVIEGPALINEMVEVIQPVPEGFYPPKIDSAEEEIIKLTWDGAYALYGEKMPQEIRTRIEREIDSITRHGFSVLYLIAHKLVKKSNQDGYLVGSRGSVGSSHI